MSFLKADQIANIIGTICKGGFLYNKSANSNISHSMETEIVKQNVQKKITAEPTPPTNALQLPASRAIVWFTLTGILTDQPSPCRCSIKTTYKSVVRQ